MIIYATKLCIDSATILTSVAVDCQSINMHNMIVKYNGAYSVSVGLTYLLQRPKPWGQL